MQHGVGGGARACGIDRCRVMLTRLDACGVWLEAYMARARQGAYVVCCVVWAASHVRSARVCVVGVQRRSDLGGIHRTFNL